MSKEQYNAPTFTESDIKSQQIISEWDKSQGVISAIFSPHSTQFLVPSIHKYTEQLVSLNDTNCEHKKLIFSALYTACYILFFTNREAQSNKGVYRDIAVRFITYLNDITITKNNRTNILKNYEEFRVKTMGVKTQSSGLKHINRFIAFSLDYPPFLEVLSTEQYEYLRVLKNTKTAPLDSKDSYTLTNWFAFHSWLRRDDIGIGNDLFNRLASPKALTLSMRITTEITLHSMQLAKYALIEFFKHNNITPDLIALPLPRPKQKDFSKNDFKIQRKRWLSYIYPFLVNRFRFLQKKHLEYSNDNKHLQVAFEIILYSWCKNTSTEDSLTRFHRNQIMDRFAVDGNKNSDRFSLAESWLFSHEFLHDLSGYAHSDKKGKVPICKIEHLLFQWLMAYQSVQASDISKLELSDFNFVRRRNGNITHISSNYFKGRSQAAHHLKDIKANSTMGRAVLNFINDNTANRRLNLGALSIPYNDSGMTTYSQGALATVIDFFAKSNIRSDIDEALQKYNATPVFIDAFHAIVKYGIDYEKYRVDKRKKYSKEIEVSRNEWQEKCETFCNKNIFGLSAIKNSAVHSRSDSFSPTMLQNYNSHSNKTERKSYRTEDNQQWLNSCGRITRAVMQDMYINVFSPSKKQVQTYNSEFTQACEFINSQKKDLLSRVQLITGQEDGHVDELGFITSTKIMHAGLHDEILLVDTPETVMKFTHYEAEVQKKYKLLSSKAPEYLLFTVLPTVEYISILLHEKKFSKKSMIEGNALYQKYAPHLPPHFSSHLGM